MRELTTEDFIEPETLARIKESQRAWASLPDAEKELAMAKDREDAIEAIMKACPADKFPKHTREYVSGLVDGARNNKSYG